MRRHRYAALLALTLPFLPGCPAVMIGGGAVAYSSLEDRRSTGTQIDDQGIEVRIQSRVAERFKENARVTVTSFNRSVLLTGETWDEATRAEVEKIAQSIANVRAITNEIQVSGLASATSRANDTALTTKVKSRMLGNKDFNSLHVKVVTEAGVVYLMGVVTEAEGEAATEVARTTGGVRKVVKVFDYCKSTDDLCKPSQPPADKPKPPRA